MEMINKYDGSVNNQGVDMTTEQGERSRVQEINENLRADLKSALGIHNKIQQIFMEARKNIYPKHPDNSKSFLHEMRQAELV